MKTETVKLPESTLTKQQYKSFGPKSVKGYGKGAAIWAHVRYDDECGNGHNSFAITGTVRAPRPENFLAGGCLHDEIREAFPELAPFIKWHLTSSDGPMHYLANTLYLAGNRDCWGKLKGEPKSFDKIIRWKKFPIEWGKRNEQNFITWIETAGTDLEVLRIDHDDKKTFGGKFTFGGFGKTWYDCPFDSEREALQFLEALKLGFKVESVPVSWGEGKERELDAARNAAVWPEATDAELCADNLKERLKARLPALMVEFKKAMETLNFTY